MGRQGRLKRKLKQILPAVTVTLSTAAPFALWTPTANAFFPPMWPVSPPVTVLPPPVSPPVIVDPPSVPPVIVEPPVVPPVIVVPPSVPPPSSGTPEPATLVSGLIGLAAAAGYGLKRRAQKKDEAKAE
jgi:hypothetical protein